MTAQKTDRRLLLAGIAFLAATAFIAPVRADAVITDPALELFGAEAEVALDEQRAKGVTIDVDQTGTVVGNTVGDNSITGDNTIANEAFGNAAGMFTVIQNSGNNVLIQNTTVYNINMY